MKKLLAAAAVLALAATGCTKQQAAPVVCPVLYQAVTAAAGGVGAALGCSNTAAIAATLGEPISKLNLCASTQSSGLIGNMVCPQVASTIMSIGLQSLPASWACTGGSLGAQAQQLITQKCEASVTF